MARNTRTPPSPVWSRMVLFSGPKVGFRRFTSSNCLMTFGNGSAIETLPKLKPNASQGSQKNGAKKNAKQRAERHASMRGDERAEKERVDKHTQERASKERNAQAILRKTVEEFQAAEHRAAQSYEDGAKGTLSGQVFIATNGGENVKLGARKVSLLDHDAIANLCAGVRAFADAKSDQLQVDIAAPQERIAVAQKQITVANQDVVAVDAEEQEEKQQANAAAEQAE